MSAKSFKPGDDVSDALKWVLQKADGYLDLNMRAAARRELAAVPANAAQSDAVLMVRQRLAMIECDWGAAAELAALLAQRHPDAPEFLIELAYAIRRKESIPAAHTILLEGLKRFRKVAVIPYNLACYECQMGHHVEALRYLERAIKLDKSYLDIALEDRDLEILWPKIEGE